MTSIRVFLLFAHIVGMLTLFAGLALELVGFESMRRAGGRVYGIAFALILLSGIPLALRVGVQQFAWVRVSFITMLVMAILGALSRRGSKAFQRASIRTRIALGLAIVFLMVSKITLAGALIAVGIALFVGLMLSTFDRGPAAVANTNQSVY